MATTSSSPSPPLAGDFVAVVVAAGLGAVFANLALGSGIWISPDGWGYWQGSVSLLEEHRYRLFFFAEPIECWPPLFSLYLAAWQAVLGVSGQTLISSTITLVAALGFAAWLFFPKNPSHRPSKRCACSRSLSPAFSRAWSCSSPTCGSSTTSRVDT